jgi:hypothetical protein
MEQIFDAVAAGAGQAEPSVAGRLPLVTEEHWPSIGRIVADPSVTKG